MTAPGRWHKMGLMAVGFLTVIVAFSPGTPPAASAQPPTVAVAQKPPADNAPRPTVLVPAAPPLPPPALIDPRSPIPTASAPPAPSQPPKPPAPPIESEIVEPVAAVHRFTGKYLGGDGAHALVYVETGDRKAEIQKRPLGSPIPLADVDAPSEVKRLAVPAGRVTAHGGRAFLTTRRELLVVTADCEIDWRFTLPGRPDNGESLLDVVGFTDGTVLLASHEELRPGDKEPAVGRFYTLDVASGRQVAFATTEPFDPATRFEFHSPSRAGYAVSPRGVRAYSSGHSQEGWRTRLAVPPRHTTATYEALCATLPEGIGLVHSRGIHLIQPGATGTAPATYSHANYERRLFVPSRSKAGEHALAAFPSTGGPDAVQWRVPVAKPITAPPVRHGTSVYFVAGNLLYRVGADTGAVYWKLTLPLNADETLTALAFADGELRASGPGLFVRVTDRSEPRR